MMPVTSEDLEIFVFTASNSKAQENLRKSIENPIQPERIVFDSFEEMSEDLRKELNRIKDTAGGFYAWGAEPRGHTDSTWRKMTRGDYVLAYYFKEATTTVMPPIRQTRCSTTPTQCWRAKYASRPSPRAWTRQSATCTLVDLDE